MWLRKSKASRAAEYYASGEVPVGSTQRYTEDVGIEESGPDFWRLAGGMQIVVVKGAWEVFVQEMGLLRVGEARCTSRPKC